MALLQADEFQNVLCLVIAIAITISIAIAITLNITPIFNIAATITLNVTIAITLTAATVIVENWIRDFLRVGGRSFGSETLTRTHRPQSNQWHTTSATVKSIAHSINITSKVGSETIHHPPSLPHARWGLRRTPPFAGRTA